MNDEELKLHFIMYPENLKRLMADKKWLERLVWMVDRKIPEANVLGSYAAARLLLFLDKYGNTEMSTEGSRTGASDALLARALGTAVATDCSLESLVDNILAKK